MNKEIEIPESLAGSRLDRALSSLVSDYSRAQLQRWIRDGAVRLNAQQVVPRHTVEGGDIVSIQVDEQAVAVQQTAQPEPIPLNICYEDESIYVIDKPSRLVMHVAPGNYTGTLQNALLHLDPKIAAVPRCGIVHRLDKDTTGLVMVARTLSAHHHLVQQLQDRSVHRVYHAIVAGVPVSGATVDEPIGRHPVDRKRMSVNANGKPAITHFRIERKFAKHCHVRVQLETGRTHQIRVHMAHLRYPLIGDSVYGGRSRPPGGCSEEMKQAVMSFPRQALHAAELGIEHPLTGELMRWESPLPEDLVQLLQVLERG